MSTLTIGGFPNYAPPSFFDACAHTSHFLRHLVRTIELVRAAGTQYGALLHYLLTKKGNGHVDLGQYQQALAAYDDALQIAPSGERRVVLLAVSGRVLGILLNFAAAATRFAEAAALAAEQADPALAGFVLEQQVYVAGEIRQDYEQARALALESISLAEASQDRRGLVDALQNLGAAEFRLGLERALVAHKEAQRLAEADGIAEVLPSILEDIGRTYHARFERKSADEYLRRALQKFSNTGKLHEAMRLRTLMGEFGYSYTED